MTDRTRDIMAALAPGIAKLSSDRRVRRDILLGQLHKLAMATAVLALLMLFAGGGLFLLAIVAGLVIGAWLTHRAQLEWEKTVRAEVIPAVCAAIDQLDYQPGPPVGNFLSPFETLGLVGSSNRKELQHCFSGSHEGRRFECLHASLQHRSGGKSGSTTPVFHGMLFRIEQGSETPSPVVILPNVTTLRRQTGKTLVPLGNPDFDRVFLVSHELEAEAGEALVHATVSPPLQQAMLAINRGESRETPDMAALRVGFMYDSIYLALSRWEHTSTLLGLKIQSPRHFLETRSLLREQADVQQTVATMVQDITTVHRIIAALGNSA
jgi:hypothetical protein